MKTIKLWVHGKGFNPFQYESLKDLEKELLIRNIKIGHGATIGDYAKIGYGAKIENDATIIKTLFITGSVNTVNWWSTGIINIGCEKHSIEHWKQNFKEIGENQGYTEKQIDEYEQYILLIEKLQSTI